MRIPGPKWGAGRPPLETPKSSLARPSRPNSSPLRGWSFGAVGESASACALATAAAPPPLRGGGFAPWPPAFPVRKSLPVMRVWGLRPLAPCVPQRGKFADHARQRMVPRPKRLLRQRLRKSPGSSCREAARSSVTPLARLCRRHSSATARGNPKGGAALFGQSLPTFCWPESRGPARPERVEGIRKDFKERHRRTKKPRAA